MKFDFYEISFIKDFVGNRIEYHERIFMGKINKRLGFV